MPIARWRFRVAAGLTFLLLICLAASGVLAQSADFDVKASQAAAVIGKPFSAVKFTRTVHVEKDGTLITLAETHHLLLARDGKGRVYMDGTESTPETCDLPELGKLPRCDSWHTFLFDPNAGVVFGWMDGEFGDHTQYIETELRSDQLEEAKRLTWAFQNSQKDSEEEGTTVQDLGEREIEGVRAKGMRVTTSQGDGSGHSKKTIREVWTSDEMRLVIRVIDGDPEGDEVISGLEHVSLSPKSSLFQPPLDRILRDAKNRSWAADHNIADLADWLVR